MSGKVINVGKVLKSATKKNVSREAIEYLKIKMEDEIEKTTAYIKNLQPTYVIPSHCTGFQASSQFARQMPDAFIEGVVGATYHF